ncbi:MAG: hypothetical protein JO002_15820 [Burkholderiaceae bacterium]|nr:hypothetical protein [Burkholderiaceae bacterium]
MNRRSIGYILAALIPCAAHAQSALTLPEKQAAHTARADLQKNELFADKSATKPLALTEAEIQKAIKEVLAAEPAPNIPAHTGAGAYSAATSIEQRMTRAFNEAKVPDCLHADAMKFTPPQIGPVALGGVFALPFWGYAALTGKCR